MGNQTSLDLEAAFAVLEGHERESVRSLASSLGVDDWCAVAPFRRIVVAVAVQRLAADMHDGLSPLGRLREACWALGAGAGGAKLADAISKTVRRWQSDRDKMSAEDAA